MFVSGLIHERLAEHFGSDAVFTDIDSIPLGVNFKHYIDEQVSKCDIFLAIIGERWLKVTDDCGRPRLNQAEDFVRLEIESALRREIPVVPLLVGNVSMPSATELPESLRELTFRNGTPIRPKPSLNADIERLVKGIDRQLVNQAKREKAQYRTKARPEDDAEVSPVKPWKRETANGAIGGQLYRDLNIEKQETTHVSIPDCALPLVPKTMAILSKQVLLIALGWAITTIISSHIGFNTNSLLSAMLICFSSGAIGGLVTGLLLKKMEPAITSRQLFLIALGWAIAACFASHSILEASLAIDSSIDSSVSSAISGATSGLVMGMFLQKAEPSIRSRQLFLIVLGWAIAMSFATYISFQPYGGYNLSIIIALSGVIGGFIGGGMMLILLSQLRR